MRQSGKQIQGRSRDAKSNSDPEQKNIYELAKEFVPFSRAVKSRNELENYSDLLIYAELLVKYCKTNLSKQFKSLHYNHNNTVIDLISDLEELLFSDDNKYEAQKITMFFEDEEKYIEIAQGPLENDIIYFLSLSILDWIEDENLKIGFVHFFWKYCEYFLNYDPNPLECKTTGWRAFLESYYSYKLEWLLEEIESAENDENYIFRKKDLEMYSKSELALTRRAKKYYKKSIKIFYDNEPASKNEKLLKKYLVQAFEYIDDPCEMFSIVDGDDIEPMRIFQIVIDESNGLGTYFIDSEMQNINSMGMGCFAQTCIVDMDRIINPKNTNTYYVKKFRNFKKCLNKIISWKHDLEEKMKETS